MSEKVECEIAICMDEDGVWAVREWADRDDAVSAIGENGGMALRTVRLTVLIMPPQVEETTIDVPDEAGETKQVQAAIAECAGEC